jgi:short-subunit dehydrogenase
MIPTTKINILILGASSQIGYNLALCFSKNNSLVLLGRQGIRLNETAAQCLLAGASHAEVLIHDLAGEVDVLIRQLKNKKFDLIINLIATTSRVKDREFSLCQLERYVSSDLVVPVKLIQILRSQSAKPLKVIFISSILASVPSPDRQFYGSLKMLQEICLHKLFESCKDTELLIVKVGTVVPHDRLSQRSINLAKAIYCAHIKNVQVLNYGVVGRLYVWLFNIQPLVFFFVTKLQRALRGR